MDILNNINDITKEIVDAVLDLLKDKVCKIVLFGSYARGDFIIGSDIDIMILLDCPQEEIRAYRKQVSKLASRLGLKNDIEISLMLQDRETFEHHLKILPFYRNVKDEGVTLYG